jgi:hypothetical protein
MIAGSVSQRARRWDRYAPIRVIQQQLAVSRKPTFSRVSRAPESRKTSGSRRGQQSAGKLGDDEHRNIGRRDPREAIGQGGYSPSQLTRDGPLRMYRRAVLFFVAHRSFCRRADPERRPQSLAMPC